MPAPLSLGALLIDPARFQELVDPEFVPHSRFFRVAGKLREVGGEYCALPALTAAEPSVFGCFLGKGDLARSAVVALVRRDGVSSFQRLTPPVVVRTNTVAAQPEGVTLSGCKAASTIRAGRDIPADQPNRDAASSPAASRGGIA